MRPLAFLWLALLSGCVRAAQAPAVGAESAYTTQQAACATTSKTLAESTACRDRVDAQWGVRPRAVGAP